MQTRTLFSKLKKALAPIAAPDGSPTWNEVMTAVHLRRDLLLALGLPATRHNTDRLVTWALAGLTLRSFIRDVDVFFPDAALADEALFLCALSAHCARRRVHSRKARRRECAAFLRMDATSHGAIVDAVTDGGLSPYAAMMLVRLPATAA